MMVRQTRIAKALILTVITACYSLAWVLRREALYSRLSSWTALIRLNSSSGVVDISPALDCLGHSSNAILFDKAKNVTIQYPSDPKDHFEEIQNRLDKWSLKHIPPHHGPGYDGPWIEDVWQQHYLTRAEYLTNANFSSVFGPYIPLLTAWTDVWLQMNYQYNDRLLDALKAVLRPNVIYITVCQNDDGFPGDNPNFQALQDEYNIVVMSAGGYGHVAVPLLKQTEQLRPKPPVHNRTHLVSYVGSRDHAPKAMRYKMLDTIGDEHYYYGEDWRSVMRDSKFSLCPRGFGRTSYHVMETLQMGLIPIQVYLEEDIPWLPYADTILKDISFTSTVQDLPILLEELKRLSDAEIERMEETIASRIDNFFTFDGVMVQMEQLMVNPSNSSLRCQALPSHVGSNRQQYFKQEDD